MEADAAAAALAVVSANPAVPLCAFAQGLVDSGVKFFVPSERRIVHGTNIKGFLDAVPALEEAARTDAKIALLLRLYRASLREPEIDNQILFQLILLEEASDNESGTLAERLHSYAEKHHLLGALTHVAQEAGVVFPAGKNVVDLLVKMRNATAHNGALTEEGLREFGAAWAIPLLKSKETVHKLVGEALRVLFCTLVGSGPDEMFTVISEPTVVRFD